MVVGALLLVGSLPVLVPLALLVDTVRAVSSGTPFMATRMLAFGVVYLAAEVAGLAALAVIVATSPTRRTRLRRTFRLQVRWAATLLSAVESIFSLELNASGGEAVTPGPILVLARHTSLVDNLLPSRYVAQQGGIDLRYVLKDELRSDPALDLVGSVLPNAFVERTGDTARSIAAIERLTRGLGPSQGILLFPEGTRFTPAKLERAMASLGRRRPRIHELAVGLTSVMPPRVGGMGAVLDNCRADVVVLAHRGLDGFAHLADVWRGAMVGRRVDVRLWRIPRSEVPDERSARLEWLFGVWHELDRWVTAGAAGEEEAIDG